MFTVSDFVSIILLILACVFGYLAFNERSKDNSTLYQSVSAVIYDVYTEPQYTTDANGYNYVQYQLFPMYKYTVGQNQFVGRYLEGTYNEGYQGVAYSRILNGEKNMNVFYEKANPSNSARSFPKNNFMMYLVLTAVAIFIAIIVKFGKFSSPRSYGPRYY